MSPNPTTGLLTINLPVNTTGDVRIINMMGKTERLFTNVTRQVDLGGLNAGIYLVQVNTDNNVYTNLIQKI